MISIDIFYIVDFFGRIHKNGVLSCRGRHTVFRGHMLIGINIVGQRLVIYRNKIGVKLYLLFLLSSMKNTDIICLSVLSFQYSSYFVFYIEYQAESLFLKRSLSEIMAINSLFVGFPLLL